MSEASPVLPHDRARQHLRPGVRTAFLPLLVLLVGLAVTALVAFQLHRTAEARDQERFARLADERVIAMRDRLETHLALLRGAAGLFAASGDVSREDFQAYVGRLRLPEIYPGVQGIGLALLVRPGEAEAITEALRREGFPDFRIQPEGPREVVTTIAYLEPLDRRNQEAIGFDMYSEPTRRAAMAQARDTGRAAMSGKVTLVQEIDADKQAGFLIYLPVYEGRTVPPTVEERRARLVGWVYSPFRAGDLLGHAIAGGDRREVDLAVYDGEGASEDGLLYASSPGAPGADPRASVQGIEVAGRPWTIVVTPTAAFDVGSSRGLLPYVALTGLLVSLALAGATWRQAAAHAGAERTNARMTAVLESVSDGFFALDPEWRFTIFNAAAERHLGLSRDEVIGRTLREVLPSLAGGGTEGRLRGVMKGGAPVSFETRLDMRPDRVVELRVARKATGGLAVSFTDITERRAQAEAVATLAAEYAAVLGQLGEGVIVADSRGRIRFVNEAAARLHGTARLDVGPEDYSETYCLFTEDGRPHPPEDLPLSRAVLGDETVQDARWRIRRPDGREVLAIGNARPVLDPEGRKIGAVLTIRDDTARSAAEEALRTRSADLAAANEEIQRVAYIISHDLRAPLVNIMGFTSELDALREVIERFYREAAERAPETVTAELREAIETDLPEAIGFIRGSSSKMDRLINAILKLSREGRRVLTPEPLRVGELVQGIAATLESQIQEGGATLEVGDLPDLVADRLAVEQIFGNLIENAVKYLAPGRPGRIAVSGRDRGATVEYVVEDNGRGIEPKDHERIFELFRRAGRQDRPGEGIGLANVRALVRRLGGSIRVRSEPDHGSVFTVELPKVPMAELEKVA